MSPHDDSAARSSWRDDHQRDDGSYDVETWGEVDEDGELVAPDPPAALGRDELALLRERFENGQRALDPTIALRLIAQAESAVPSSAAAYRFLGPVARGRGYCTTKCDYDINGVCSRCECLDPERFIVIEYPTKEQDAQMQMVKRLQSAGIEVRRV